MIHGHHNDLSLTSPTPPEQTPACPIASPTRAHLSCIHYTPRSVVLTTAIISVQSPEGRTVRTRALLDQCSESNFITASLANTLGLRKSRVSIPVFGVLNCKAGTAEAFATHNILTSSDPPCLIPVQSLILPTLTHLLPARKMQTSSWPHLMDLQLADPEFHRPSHIDLILGVEIYNKVLLGEFRRGPDGAPFAQATSLGWILSGPVDKETSTNHIMFQSHCALLDVDRTLRRFWEIEDTPDRVHLTPQEEECENMFLHSHKRDAEGRYVVRLPMKSNALHLGDSRKAAVSALLRLEKRFAQDNNLHRDYSDFLEEYQTLGHLEHVVDEQENDLRQFYVPHHAILKPSSTTTKLRVVFNGSQKTSSGVSLNDLLHIGPKLQNDIFHVINKWRLYPLVFTADIEKMYRQIRVHRDDVDLQRILWRRTTQEPIRCYRLMTVTYGTACAPYLACRTLRQLCNDYQHEFPAAAKIVQENFYVDDALFGAYDHQSAQHIKTEVRNLLSKGGFKLRKWLTNAPKLISDIPEEDRELKTQVKIVEDAQVKTLGLGWNPSQDKFMFQIHLPQQVSSTKRSILSDISRIYDPLGWLSPTTIIAKVFLQKLWLAKVDWDEELPEELSIKWNHYRQEMNVLTCIQIDRWMGTTDPHNSTMNLQLHGFCDASLSAYAAVVYLRITSGHHDARVSLVASKTRVSPLKTVSLPRLELCGATLLAELITTVQQEPYLNKIPVYVWTDSTIVLTWLGEHPSRWKVFVANRVSTIHSIIPTATWNHVPTDDNPADCATRGLSPAELQGHELWWIGPQWLRKSQASWPKRAPNLSSDHSLEERRETTILVAHHQTAFNSLLHRYSNLGKLIRITAYCCRFIYNASHQSSHRKRGHLTATEKNAALDRWLHIAQQSSYATEISDLNKGTPISTKSKICNLSPFIDDQGFLRVGGRLQHATPSYAERCPIILHKDSHLTRLVIDHAHSRTLHGGTQLTLHHLRTRYWIPSGRNTVRQFIRRCIICYRYQAKAKNQIMSVLPRDRVRPSKPFTISGVDYAGPFKTKPVKGRGRTILKSYVAIFACFATRAVHLELVLDLTTESFLAAFKRFVARRGHCAKIYSDNATNFVGAARELDKHFHQLHQDSSLIQSLTDGNTEWHFIPPASPHFGGLWEAGVKSFKHHLRRIIGDHLLSIEETLTLVAQIEMCLNYRPLNAISDDPDDLQALTPGHFLVGCNLLTVPEPSLIETPANRLTRWQLVQAMYEHLWQRWHKEYLHELQIRNKWSQRQDPVQVNDLVLLKEDKLPPSNWLLGRITEVHPGEDGNIRVVTLKHKNGYCKRPIVKICVLPIHTSEL